MTSDPGASDTTASQPPADGSSAAPDETDQVTPEVLIVTGMSGAGRSTAADVLEDLGWYVVDNLPPSMLHPLATLAAHGSESMPRLAVVVDVRGGSFFTDLSGAIRELAASNVRSRILYLDADDAALVRRFESVRRPHPLQGGGRILDGIVQERALVGDLRGSADLVIDSSTMNVHQLGAKIAELFAPGEADLLRITVMSFGFKYGLPVDADHVVDVRFLPNPFWVPELRGLTGQDSAVSDYVMRQDGAEEFVSRYARALEPVIDGYQREHRRYVTIGIGCTGGKHRSVTIARRLVVALAGDHIRTVAVHRDLGRE